MKPHRPQLIARNDIGSGPAGTLTRLKREYQQGTEQLLTDNHSATLQQYKTKQYSSINSTTVVVVS